ncbi:transposase [Chitinophaga sp. OAE865]|uniref:transposase n=1 Tax=Chitinophaga sp. OAE865 TaxID=2817898 RepID=UPI001AEB1AA0
MNDVFISLEVKADKRLNTKRGVEKRKRRCFDVEPVFANIKHNHQFNRFMLRGIDKVTVEMGLLALTQNKLRFQFRALKRTSRS